MENKQDRFNYSTGSPFEPLRGYSRAVRVGDHLFISGTTAIKENGDVLSINDAYEQTKSAILVVKKVLQKAGFSISDVVRTRLYVTDISKWDEYARAHREAFESIRPASSIVQVQRLVDPRLLVEIEVDALLGCNLIDRVVIE